ncbi:hypothetical protein PSYJA_05869 [Pseudomonas syringae pv. japonica str. M301072]|uniref:Uncharacterized protein n=1 Tax=Pseudomonas syringae pv. japonica str. M301072 TaxID=629262 RepID=F3FE94_PSESX|nr:hypothetical protein PSYJA_05869 [Pseudomonas syringae pv. japonica str. M301072]
MQVERDHAVLVSVQLAQRPLVQWPADHATQIASAEPGLVFEEEGEELAVVAVEGGWGEAGTHLAPLTGTYPK